jgi:hypothetical protein
MTQLHWHVKCSTIGCWPQTYERPETMEAGLYEHGRVYVSMFTLTLNFQPCRIQYLLRIRKAMPARVECGETICMLQKNDIEMFFS